jgi:hypothetical protein
VRDCRTLVPLRAQLLLHRVLDRRRRIDRLQLDAVDADAPATGRVVEHAAQLAVDLVARGERLLEVEPANDVPQRRDDELLDSLDVVRDLEGRGLRIGHLEVDDRVDVDDEVVLRDDRLRRERHDLLAEIDHRARAVDERDDEHEARRQRAA